MADDIGKAPVVIDDHDSKQQALSHVVDEAAAIPKGTLDPVYEAKARVLNHAVRT